MQGSWQHSACAGGLSVPHCHAGHSLCLHTQPGICEWWQSSVGHQALPSLASCLLSALFQPSALYEIVLLWEINYRGMAQWASPSARAASEAAACMGMGLCHLGVPFAPGMYLWW